MDLDHAPVGQLDCEGFEWGPRLEMANLIRHISRFARLIFLGGSGINSTQIKSQAQSTKAERCRQVGKASRLTSDWKLGEGETLTYPGVRRDALLTSEERTATPEP